MIIHQFRQFRPLNILLLSVVAVLLSLGVFIHLPDQLVPVVLDPLIWDTSTWLDAGFISPEANVLIALLLTLLQALYLNRIINWYNLYGKSSYLPALMYVTLSSLMLPFLVLSPALICNFLSIWMLGRLLSIYKESDVKAVMFDLGFVVAAGSLIYFPFVCMFILLCLGLVVFRPFNWREWASACIGFITVYFLLAVVYFWQDRLDDFYTLWLPFTHPFPTSIAIDVYDYLVVLPVLVILVSFLFVLQKTFFKNVVHVRKTFRLLFFMLLIGIGSFYLSQGYQLNHLMLCIPPLSIYMGYYFQDADRAWFYESLFGICLLMILYFQFF